jgi:hypothetical protein
MRDLIERHLDYLIFAFDLNAIAAFAFLGLELLSRPKLYRVALIALTGLSAVFFGLQAATGYFLAFKSGETVDGIGMVVTYVLLMMLTLSGKRMAWQVNRVGGIFGLVFPFVVLVLDPELVIFLGIFLFGIYHNKPIFQGRVSSNLAYSISYDEHYYQLSFLRNPWWTRIVRKQVDFGSIYNCDAPATRVSVEANGRNDFARIVCEETSVNTFATEIPIDPLEPPLAGIHVH